MDHAGAILPDSLQRNLGPWPLRSFLKAKGPLFGPDLAMDINSMAKGHTSGPFISSDLRFGGPGGAVRKRVPNRHIQIEVTVRVSAPWYSVHFLLCHPVTAKL